MMNKLLNYFFSAIGLVTLFWVYQSNPDLVTISEWARFVQSSNAQKMVVIVALVQLGFGLAVNWAGFRIRIALFN